MPRPSARGQARMSGGGGGFVSPFGAPQHFQNQVRNHFASLGNQFGGGRNGMADATEPRFNGGRGGGGPYHASASGDPAGNPDFGGQEFGTYAADTNAGQFQNENFKGAGFKGVRKLNDSGMMSGFGGMGSLGYGGFGGGGGMGGSQGFGGGMDIMSMFMNLMSQLQGQGEDDGPIRGK